MVIHLVLPELLVLKVVIEVLKENKDLKLEHLVLDHGLVELLQLPPKQLVVMLQ
jgi:hypothetical protein